MCVSQETLGRHFYCNYAVILETAAAVLMLLTAIVLEVQPRVGRELAFREQVRKLVTNFRSRTAGHEL